MAGKVDRLMADPFLQAAVAGDDIGAVIDQFLAVARRHHALGERHADGRGKALAERPGRRLDAERVTMLGMAGRAAAELAETLQFPDRHVLDSRSGDAARIAASTRAPPKARSGRGPASPASRGRA